MDTSNLKFSLKEVISICVVVFSISVGFVWLKSDVNEMKENIQVIRIDIAAVNRKVNKLVTDQTRLDLIVGLMYNKALKDNGLSPSKYTLEEFTKLSEIN